MGFFLLYSAAVGRCEQPACERPTPPLPRR
jgi:hypothetical protein